MFVVFTTVDVIKNKNIVKNIYDTEIIASTLLLIFNYQVLSKQ